MGRYLQYPERKRRSKAFYVEGLGFKIDWEHQFEPNFPVFALITKDEMTIYLTEHTGDCQFGGFIHFFVPKVDSWYSELKINNLKRSGILVCTKV
ncbi:glyoxalase superfamily protein [uncultured Brevibacillus sp.]|uniref:glyoxalase superfamily protein n=1 Tax=uncultured Brevibacillus sp. TaxID=169970 RepID=UPI0025916F8B|nr:glyoxalase superfamily protein [uncultured Brevibacillus sp.]